MRMRRITRPRTATPSGHFAVDYTAIAKYVAENITVVRTTVGSVVGMATGGIVSAIMHTFASTGSCGRELQRQANDITIGEAVIRGMATGTAIGAATGSQLEYRYLHPA